MNVLITGSSGFLGAVLARQLQSASSPIKVKRVVLFDLQPPPHNAGETDSRFVFVRGDVCDCERHPQTAAAFAGIDLVFHLAAIVDWGTNTEQRVFDVNVGGTTSIIKACQRAGVRALVYTSSEDAIIGVQQDLRNVDESLAYPDVQPNAAIIRPADLYGEGDKYHLGALIDMAQRGFYVRLGDGTSVCQHVHVENCAHAHLLLGRSLLDDNDKCAAQVYFITDGDASNFFTFYGRILSEAGYRLWPNLFLPYWFSMLVATIVETLFYYFPALFGSKRPTFCRFAVQYTCNDFTFTSAKAASDFGFKPLITESEAIRRTIAYYRAERTKSGM